MTDARHPTPPDLLSMPELLADPDERFPDTVELKPASQESLDDFKSEMRACLISIEQSIIGVQAHQVRRDKVVNEVQVEARASDKATARRLDSLEREMKGLKTGVGDLVKLLRKIHGNGHSA